MVHTYYFLDACMETVLHEDLTGLEYLLSEDSVFKESGPRLLALAEKFVKRHSIEWFAQRGLHVNPQNISPQDYYDPVPEAVHSDSSGG